MGGVIFIHPPPLKKTSNSLPKLFWPALVPQEQHWGGGAFRLQEWQFCIGEILLSTGILDMIQACILNRK